jgi:hypothetical protein
MANDQKSNERNSEREPAAPSGNASNPVSRTGEDMQPQKNQLLDEKASTYIRESGNIEDMPDDLDEEDMDETIKKESGHSNG